MSEARPPVALLTPRRLSYAWIAGGALWAVWLISLWLGQGLVDRAGQAVGTDYVQFYSAGRTVAAGESARLYDIDYQLEVERQIVGPELNTYFAFITPPFLAWLYAPLAALPYGASFALWCLLGLGGLYASLRLVGSRRPERTMAWALTWFPVFASISYGQNSLLSLLLASLTFWLWVRGRPLAAGLACSLLMYKPQLALGIALLWALEWRRDRRALAGLAAGSTGLALLSAWLLPDASRAYLEFARTVLPDLPRWQQFPLWNLHTVRGFWRLLLPAAPLAADALYLAVAAGAVAAFVRFWKAWRGQRELLFAAAIALTLAITPHAIIYDWTLLLIPAVVLWERLQAQRPAWQLLYAAVWLVSFVSGPLTYGQLHLLPAALQISVPVLLLALGVAWRKLIAEEGAWAASPAS